MLRPAQHPQRLRVRHEPWLVAHLRTHRDSLRALAGSTLAHALLLLLLTLWRTSVWYPARPEALETTITPTEIREVAATVEHHALDAPEVTSLLAPAAVTPQPEIDPGPAGGPPTSLAPDAPAATLSPVGPSQSREALDQFSGSALAGRDPAARARLAELRGGNAASEQAVLRGLNWLAAHQRPDGSWHFNHHDSPCQGLCRDPGSHGSTTAATALALLPFLGAGHTHRAGEFQSQVEQGLYYLLSRLQISPQGGDLQEGTMYAQGLAAITLAEAYAMTGDRQFERPAQLAIDFIVFAQDKGGGGWRYFPGQLGDLSVTGWQFMALKSAQLAYLRVPPAVATDATRFLDSVQAEGGARYGYQTPQAEPTMTAVGLLCRMYSGWKRDDLRLARGVDYLAAEGPSSKDMYYNYYATQVLHHWDGPVWHAWNAQLRDALVDSQEKVGHEAGSWYFPSKHTITGGRLLSTSLSVMTLEVYYRYLPLYTPISFSEF